jgi:hypothetical protein
MKPSLFSAPTLFATLLLAGLATGAAPVSAEDKPEGKAAMPDGDTVIVLASDTSFGPDMGDTDTAVRYYCSTRGKLSVFVGKDRPPEMRNEVFQAWSVLTYRCVAPEIK